MHIVSNIRGRMRPDRDCFDLLKAVFPGGTISGVPKVRCLEIIKELEPVERGAAYGSIGYISFAGDMLATVLVDAYLLYLFFGKARSAALKEKNAGVYNPADH